MWVWWVLIEEGEGRELFFEEGEGRELVLRLSGFRKVLFCVNFFFFFCVYVFFLNIMLMWKIVEA